MPPDERLGHIAIEDEMKSSYLDYAMSVIVGRALPDVRDGLKPVHRRILFGMNEMGLASNRAYRKSAKIVGEIMGNYHPHGDTAIYDTLVRMAQDFNMRYLLVDGQDEGRIVDILLGEYQHARGLLRYRPQFRSRFPGRLDPIRQAPLLVLRL